MSLDELKALLERSQTTVDLISRNKYEQALSNAIEQIEGLIYAYHECPEDSVPEILQTTFEDLLTQQERSG